VSYTLDFPIQYIANPDRFATIGLGELYIGVVDGDPAFEPSDRIQVYIARQNDTDLAIPQPIELSAGGVPTYLGSPVTLKIDQSFSCAVLDKQDQQVYYSPKAGETIDELNNLLAEIELVRDNAVERIENYGRFAFTEAIPGKGYYLMEYTEGTGSGGGPLIGKAGVVIPNDVTTFAGSTAGTYFERVNVVDITLEMAGGAEGENNQEAWERVYDNFSTLTLLDRDYKVDNLNIRKPFTIKTKGLISRLTQNEGVTGTNQEISVITVASSDVVIEDIALRGNIATDTGEDRHGIRVDASTVPGGISKIHIGNVNGSAIRGDVVVFTGSTGRDVSDFSVGNVSGFNIFRNGFSLVSGKNGKIGVVTVAGEGLFAFDSEPDSGGGVVENVTVAGVRGRHCGVPAVTSVQKGITFGFVDLDWSLPQSTPAFSPAQESEEHGLVYRSTNGCHIEYCRLQNFPESPIRVFKELTDEYVDNISFGTLIIENCLTDTSNPPCLIRASGAKNIVVRGTLKYMCTSSALHELILDGATTGFVRLSANRIEGNAPIGRYISVDCQSSEISYGDDRSCLIFTGNCTFNNSVWDVGIIASSSVGLLTFTSSSLKWTGSFKYADGITTNFHTYELNSMASVTVGAAPTWAATRVDS
jgi:hypothetical protein